MSSEEKIRDGEREKEEGEKKRGRKREIQKYEELDYLSMKFSKEGNGI